MGSDETLRKLLADAAERGIRYRESCGNRSVAPSPEAVAAVPGFVEPLPENGCPIRKVEINESVEMIILDTEWYLAKWDRYPTINDDCEFRTRSRFFDEFESLIKKARLRGGKGKGRGRAR